jgi:hypothetical protein
MMLYFEIKRMTGVGNHISQAVSVKRGIRQVVMALMEWAIDVIQIFIQREAMVKAGANPIKVENI